VSNTDRQHDLVVWGQLASLAASSPSISLHSIHRTSSLALGGRSESRLQEVQTALGKRRSAWDDIPIVLGDATEPESLHAIAEDTRVVCTTVGPYTTYGTPLVEACIAAETDYCDLTGEVNWVREMIDRYHDDAVEAGTRIVHSCGFDSIPLISVRNSFNRSPSTSSGLHAIWHTSIWRTVAGA